jgi:uncharacterized protein involved in response to NO
MLPWSVLAITGVVAGPASLSTGAGHAHELLLGYALAVVAGNQLPRMPAARALLLLAVWMCARVAFVGFPGGLTAMALDVAFATALALHVAPRLFSTAKKLRNHALPAALTGLCAAVVAYEAAAFLTGSAALHEMLLILVLLLATLMLFMGGRIIAAAAAGQFYRQGQSLAARVQPRIESSLMVAMTVAVGCAAVPQLDLAMRVACAGAGGLALVRLLRWRLWACKGRGDLMCLGVGYGWLTLGLWAIAVSAPSVERTVALHLVTIGALGTLTFNVMAATMLRRARRDPAQAPILLAGTALIGVATLFRVAAGFGTARAELLILAAACWTGAFVILSWLMARSLVRRAH